jgi:hypothetical protein
MARIAQTALLVVSSWAEWKPPLLAEAPQPELIFESEFGVVDAALLVALNLNFPRLVWEGMFVSGLKTFESLIFKIYKRKREMSRHAISTYD